MTSLKDSKALSSRNEPMIVAVIMERGYVQNNYCAFPLFTVDSENVKIVSPSMLTTSMNHSGTLRRVFSFGPNLLICLIQIR